MYSSPSSIEINSTRMVTIRRSRSDLLEGGSWLVFAPLSPAGWRATTLSSSFHGLVSNRPIAKIRITSPGLPGPLLVGVGPARVRWSVLFSINPYAVFQKEPNGSKIIAGRDRGCGAARWFLVPPSGNLKTARSLALHPMKWRRNEHVLYRSP